MAAKRKLLVLQSRPVFSEMSHTELWQMAMRMKIPGASPACTREALVHALENLEEIDADNPVDQYRQRLSSWLERHWDIMRMQVPEAHCPNCALSSDMQFANCWLDNCYQVT